MLGVGSQLIYCRGVQPPEPRHDNCRHWCDLARELGKCTVICQRLRWEKIDTSCIVASMDDAEFKRMYDNACKRGYVGRTRQVACSHIRHLIDQASDLVKRVESRVFPEPYPGGEVEDSRDTERALERAAQLLRHAAEELEDERLRLRDGWPA